MIKKIALALMLYTVLVGVFSVKAFGFDAYASFDNETKAYIKETNAKIAVLEKVAQTSTDYELLNGLYKMYATIDGLYKDMSNCPLRNAKEAQSYCKTRWIIKMKPLYTFLNK